MIEPIHPAPPSRIVDPERAPVTPPSLTRIVEPEAGDPPVVCKECTIAADDALSAAAERSHAKPQSHKEEEPKKGKKAPVSDSDPG